MEKICCDGCFYQYYDDTYAEFFCSIRDSMDEDDVFRLLNTADAGCPYFRPGDEYTVVRHQN